MDLDFERQVEQLFQDVVELPPAQRTVILNERNVPTTLRERVEHLLALHDAAAGPDLKTPNFTPKSRSTQFPKASVPPNIGPYTVLRLIAEGGMGAVYLAEQTKPIHRQVAIKVIKLGMDTRAVMARFELEREALALMNHPHVARVLEAGATEAGRPYFVMEYVEGMPITDYCDEKRLSLHQRLGLFIQVCQAIQHAHQKGIIHRDLKPSNVLVSVIDGSPCAKVIDFGIAKATQQKLTEETYATEHGLLVGTPAYMSPEQADARGIDIDTRSDIYSLGVLLYELLVGALPLDPERMRKAALSEIQRLIRETDPPKPSSRIAPAVTSLASGHAEKQTAQDKTPHAVAAKRHSDPKSLLRQVRGDLDWIVMKCLEKDRSRRYDTATSLVMELQRYLNHEPVSAGPPSRVYRVKKFVRRYRAAVLSGTVIALLLIWSSIGMTILYLRAEAQRRSAETARQAEAEQRQIAEANEHRANLETARAEQETQTARKERDKTAKFAAFMEEALEGVGPSVALGRETKLLKEVMDGAARRILAGELASAPEADLRLRLTIGRVYRDIAEYQSAEKMLADVVHQAELLHGIESPERAAALGAYARWLSATGRGVEALTRYQDALALRRKLSPGGDVEVAKSLTDAAVCLGELSRWADALPMLEEALDLHQRYGKGDELGQADVIGNIGYCLLSMGRTEEALAKLEDALTTYQRLLPGDDPRVSNLLLNTAGCLQTLGRTAEALKRYEEALDMYRRLIPGDHPHVAASLSSTAFCLSSLGRPAEAMPKYEEALAMVKRLFPGDHPMVAQSMTNVGFGLLSLGRAEETLPLYEEALAMNERLFPGDHTSVAKSLNNLAHCLDTLDRPAEALPKQERALAMYQRLFPGDHPGVAQCLTNVGTGLTGVRRFDEALRTFAESQAMWGRALPGPHPGTAQSVVYHAFCLDSMERWVDSLAKSEEALAMLAQLLPADHSMVRMSEIIRGRALVGLHRYDEAKDVLVREWENCADRFDVPRRFKIRCLDGLVQLFDALDAVEPAQDHKERAHIYRNILDGLDD